MLNTFEYNLIAVSPAFFALKFCLFLIVIIILKELQEIYQSWSTSYILIAKKYLVLILKFFGRFYRLF